MPLDHATRYAPQAEATATRLEALARLMDGAVQIPGTTVRIGLDAFIGMVPVAGDFVSAAISSYLIWEARRIGAPRWLIARMAANTLLDTTVGAIPVAGDVFDVFFRSNMKNMALLRRHLERKGYHSDARTIDAEAVRLD